MPETRQNLINAAMTLFSTKGYGATSVAEVLQVADAGSGSLYHFFPGKQDLLHAVLDAYEAGIGPMLLEPAWEGVDDPIDRVFALLDRYRDLLESSKCSYGCPIGNLALELHEPDPSVRERLAANFSAWITAIEECFRQAADRLPAGTEPRRLASFALVTMEGGVMLSRTYRDIRYFEDAVAELRRHVDGLLAERQTDHEPGPSEPR